MNFKDMVLPLVFVMSSMLLVQFFISKKFGSSNITDQKKSGQRFTAVRSEVVQKPLNLEIDFIDVKTDRAPTKTTVETPSAKYVFTDNGAALESFTYKKYTDNKEILMTPMETIVERENLCFLLALEEKTPYYYDLVDKKEENDFIQLTYKTAKSSFEEGYIEKIYKIYKDSNKIDLAINIDSKSKKVLPRVFIPAPLMQEKGEMVSGLVWEDAALKKLKMDKQLTVSGWESPEMFGAGDLYFVHSLVSDKNHFVQRAYYKIMNMNHLSFILEGQEQQNATWDMSFYFGPKQVEAMAKVDTRLEGALDYGMFSFFVKFLIYLLKFLNQYLKNYGLAIIVLTLLIRLVMLPLTYKGEKGMRERMDFQNKLEYIQRKYKDDPETLKNARAELIQKHGMPGLSSCLPLLLQLPIFIGLSRAFGTSIELYHAPFYFWIKDLSSADPYYILPAIVFFVMIWQTLETTDAKGRLPGIAMAFVFFAVTASLSSGLALYLFVTTVLGILQTKLIVKVRRD